MENKTRAFYDWSRWVANCTHCPSAMEITPKQPYLECPARPVGCGGVSTIIWPDDPDAIAASVADRPEHLRRWNWPADE